MFFFICFALFGCAFSFVIYGVPVGNGTIGSGPGQLLFLHCFVFRSHVQSGWASGVSISADNRDPGNKNQKRFEISNVADPGSSGFFTPGSGIRIRDGQNPDPG